MYEILRNYINKYAATHLSDTGFESVKKAFLPKNLRKKQYFLQEGEVCKYTGFIIKGAMRQYSVDDKGVEHIVHLCIENWWVGDRESYTMSTPSKYNIDAVEDSEMLIITNAEFQNLLSTIPAMSNMVHTMDQNNYIATQKRIHSSISLTAEDRFLNLWESNPALFQRFPQTMIASYLGISAETLSRIRKKTLRK